jgi:hypothetical protein
MKRQFLLRILLLLVLLTGVHLLTSDQAETRKELKWTYKNWWMDIQSGQWDRAYARMTPSYRERNTLQDFYREFYFAGDHDFRLHDHAEVDHFQRSARIFPGDSKNPGVAGPEYYLIRQGESWYFTGKVDRYKDRKNSVLAGILW